MKRQALAGQAVLCSGLSGALGTIRAVMASDVLREKVYSAEKQVWSALNRVGQVSMVDFFGSELALQPEKRFATIAEIETYASDVIAQWNRHYSTKISNVAVRRRKGEERAHYEFDTKTIAIPTATGWALRELVCLHEISHHLTFIYHPKAAHHGPEFAGMYIEVVRLIMGDEVALLLRAAFDGVGVIVGQFA